MVLLDATYRRNSKTDSNNAIPRENLGPLLSLAITIIATAFLLGTVTWIANTI
jgi:hypothetical protein